MRNKNKKSWFNLGECFLCRTPCKDDAVTHYECAVISLKEDLKRVKEANPKDWENNEQSEDHPRYPA